MKFGVLYWPTRTGEYPADQHFQEIAEMARAARDSGFDLFAVPNIYLASPARFFHPLPLLAALAPETGNMSLLTGIFLLALQNPVDVAEQAATLDAVSGGRFILGVGVGRPHIPCAEFGIDPAHRGARAGEALQVIKRLWTEDNVTHQGRHFTVSGATTAVKPVQKPHLPIWVGATVNRSIRRAARWGDAWYPTTSASLEELESGRDYYYECLEGFGRTTPDLLPVRRDVFVGADYETAMRDGVRSIRSETRLWGDVEYSPDRYFVGSPESIVEDIERYRERLGDMYMVFRVQWPGQTNQQVIEQLHLLGSQVFPHFR